jgi:hypothetical protein
MYRKWRHSKYICVFKGFLRMSWVKTRFSALHLAECISRWGMNLSREYCVAETRKNGCNFTEFLLESLHYRTFSIFTDIQYQIPLCKNFYLSNRSVVASEPVETLTYLWLSVSRAAAKPLSCLLQKKKTEILLTVLVEKVDNLFTKYRVRQWGRKTLTMVGRCPVDPSTYPNLQYVHICSARSCNNCQKQLAETWIYLSTSRAYLWSGVEARIVGNSFLLSNYFMWISLQFLIW